MQIQKTILEVWKKSYYDGFNKTSNKNLTSESNNVIFEISLKNVLYFSTVEVWK